MPNPRMGPLASRLVAAIFWTFPCERQVKECRASEGTVPTECGVIHVRRRNEVPARGSNGIKQANYCLSCGPDSCCAECPPAEPSLRVACLNKPVALPGIKFPRTSGFPPWNGLCGCLWHPGGPVLGLVPSREPVCRGTAGHLPGIVHPLVFQPDRTALAAGHSPISPDPGHAAPSVFGGWKVLS